VPRRQRNGARLMDGAEDALRPDGLGTPPSGVPIDRRVQDLPCSHHQVGGRQQQRQSLRQRSLRAGHGNWRRF
jgi:hypothetical protein